MGDEGDLVKTWHLPTEEEEEEGAGVEVLPRLEATEGSGAGRARGQEELRAEPLPA